MDALLNAQDVKKMLRCSIALVYKMADQGRISCIRIPCPTLGTKKKELVRFKLEDVQGFIEKYYIR